MFITLLSYFSLLTFSFILIYLVVPEIMLHWLGIGSWKRQYSPGVALTFDDGPDPKYTPLLLDILAQQRITACFFLVGQKVEKYPEIVRMIHKQGHLIGSHGYLHKHAWLMTPQKTWENWDKGLKAIEKIIGIEPDYIRPPWGGFNLSIYSWCIAKNKRIIGWNAKGKDWQGNITSSRIVDTVLQNTAEGSIILLHDSSLEEGAAANTLTCLAELIPKIKNNMKLPIVPLGFPDWTISRRVSFRLWEKWEHLYARIYGIKRIDDKNLFRLSLSRYRGPDLFNEEGELLATKGDKIGEIHLDNIRFQSAGTNLQSIGIKALKQVRLSLPNLAEYIALHPDFRNVKVYIGVTLLNRGVKGLGFSVQEYPFHNGLMIGLFQKVLMQIYHPAGNHRKTESLGDKPKMVWISKKKLLDKYEADKRIIS